MKNQEVVIYAKASTFTNDKGQVIRSGKVHILGKVSSVSNDYGTAKGHQVGEFKVPYEMAQTLVEKVPAVCDIEYDINIDRDNAVTLIPKDIKFLKEFKVNI